MAAKMIEGRTRGMFDDILRTGLSANVVEVLERIGNQMKALDAIPGSEDDILLQSALNDLESAASKVAKFNEMETAA